MSEKVLEKKSSEVQETENNHSEGKESEVVSSKPVLIWESESTFAVIPLGEQGQQEAPLLRVFTSGFGQKVVGSGRQGSGPIASLRNAA